MLLARSLSTDLYPTYRNDEQAEQCHCSQRRMAHLVPLSRFTSLARRGSVLAFVEWMKDMSLFWIAGITVMVATAIVGLVVARHRHRKDYRGYLAPELERHGLQFVSARYPGAFRVGPFPFIEPRANRHLQTNIGSFVEYREVDCIDRAGRHFTVWAQLDFVFYILQRLRWRIEAGASFPESAKGLLEN